MKHYAYRFILILLPLFLCVRCNKNNPNSVIPNVYVNVRLNINEPSSFELKPIGGWIYVNGGYNGLVVYRSDLNVFVCYDRQSTYEVADRCQVDVNNSGFLLIDSCSTSEYSIFFGSVTKGPSTIPLKQYQTSFDGTYIDIRN